jgi:hypothetical protein
MKNQKNEVVAKSKKTKSAAQRKKTEENIQKAQMRLVALQAQQRLANEMRAKGHVGGDQTMLRLVEVQERTQEEVKARLFVERVLSGPHAERVRRFIGAGLNGSPTKVALIVRNFLQTQGVLLSEAV